MKKSIFTLIGIILTSIQSIGQIVDTMSNLEQKGIFGKVETIEELYYSVNKNHENILTRAYYEIYSKEGFLLEKGIIDVNTKNKVREDIYELKYNQINKITGQYKKVTNDSLIPIVIFRYDSLNRINETIRFYTFIRGCSKMPGFYVNDGGNEKTRRKYIYDEKGNIIKCENWYWVDKNWKLRNIDDYKNKAEIKKKKVKKNQKKFHLKDKKRFIEYNQNDEYNNWTRCTDFYRRKPIEIKERKIKYFNIYPAK